MMLMLVLVFFYYFLDWMYLIIYSGIVMGMLVVVVFNVWFNGICGLYEVMYGVVVVVY